MGHELIRLGLVICPEHPFGHRVAITTEELGEIEYFIVRMVFKIGEVVSCYRYPPVEFSVAVLQAFFEANPHLVMMVAEEKCFKCKCPDFPSYSH